MRISARKRSKVHGHAVGKPLASRYQLRQPLFQIVVLAAALRSASKRAIAAREGLSSLHAPDRTWSMSCRMYENCNSATSIS